MLMTSPEKLILENQVKIMQALCLQFKSGDSMARVLSEQISTTLTIIHHARTFPESRS